MATDEKWYFTKEQLANTPSRRCGVDADKELSYRQQAANFIQDMGQRLAVTQLCINTAIVYMHRFYVFHSLSQFHRNSIASAALFLAAKVEEQPRKLEHVIKVSHLCLYRDQNPPDTKSEAYLEQAQDLVFNENVLLQTLGFDVAIDHPHTHVVRCCHLVKASKDLAQTSYFMASNSLHLTTMCLQYKPTVVACFCIHLACKWSNWEIPQSNEGKHWFWYVDRTVTSEQLQQLTGEFLHIFDKCPSRLKRKIMSISANQSPSLSHPSLPNSPFDTEPRKVQSPANDGGPTFQSLRLHHSDKQEEKKLSSSLPLRPPVDYREYREKKERERLEREKSVTSSATVQNHLPDPNKHHSHHHKSGASAVGAPGKHPLSSGQKNALHHNHHHRPDVKIGQMVPQRHSGSSQRSEVRDPNRDPNRQRVPREYNSSSGTSGGTMYSHSHPTHLSKDANVVDVNSLIDSSTSRVDTNLLQEPTPHNNPQEKLSNNNHNVHRLNATDCKPHDKRAYDPRHKPPDHRKDVDSMQKLYGKYPDPSRAERQRKPDSLEQRSEEVRKLIEKPLPPPKPRLEVQKEENIAGMLKQPHHAKFSQQDKQQNNSSVNASELKMPFASRSGYAPEIPVSATSQGIQKATATLKLLPNQLSTHGTVSQILKDTMNNGNSQPLSNAEELKTEKRMRHDEIDRTSSGLQQGPLQTPPGKHRSLFSPEKTPAPRDSHSQRVKSKQKTPPLAVVKLKQERLPDPSTNLNLVMPFSSPPGVAQQQESSQVKRSASDVTASSHKKHRMSNTNDAEQKVRMKTEDLSNFETIKMLGRVPELIQPIRDVTSSNGRSASIVNDFKPSELIKPLQPEAMSQMNIVVQELGAPSTNGLDSNVDKLLLSHQENSVKLEGIKQEFSLHEVPIVEIKKDNLSPMKSAQSISALLQEPLAPMPSLLQGMHQFGLSVQKPMYSEQIHQHLVEPIKQDPLLPVSSQSTSLPGVSEAALVPSTVDISALNAAPLPGPCEISDQTVVSAPLVVPLVGSTEKKSEHHKSEKKKKKEKHKHKDKEKAKDKHKHKHKDKEKLRLKETGGEHMPGVGSLKITIPKEKITLSTEAAVPGGTGASAAEVKNKSPQGTGLKIKIPKERLKAADSVSGPMAQPVVQAPLKIKIRTDAISRSSVTGDLIVNDSRKRERERDTTDSPASAGPPSKKHSQGGGVAGGGNSGTTNYTNQQRSGERQNGRHYNSSSNNKEKHTSSHHKSSNKLSQSQQHQHQHQQQSHAT